MNKYLTLTKTFIASVGMSKPQDKRRKVMIVILSLFAIFGVLLPVCFGVGLLLKLMTETLIPIGCEDLGIELMFYIICLFTVVFGVNVIFNEFYFSNDIEYLLPWPLHAYQIVASKFSAAFFNENIMQFTLVFSCIVGFGIGSKMGILNWLLSIIGIITLPIIPLIYCAIFSMLIMSFTRLIRNKDIIQKISVALLFLMIIALVASIGFIQNMDIDNYIETLATGDGTLFRIFNIIFPNVPLFVKTFHEASLSALLAYIGVHVIYIAIMLWIAEKLYFRGVIGLTSATTHRKEKDLDKLLSSCKQHNPAYTYFLKDIRMLVRTPVYFTNCIAINFLWPVFVYAMVKIAGYDLSLSRLRELYAHRDLKIQLFFLLGIVGISVLVSALNSLCSGAISREGKHFSFMKYIPLSYMSQWNAKVWVGMVFTFVGVWIFFLPACILIRIPVIHILIFLVLSVLSIHFICYMGIYIDSIQPKLIWDDEMSSLRENYNTFFAMAIAMAFSGIVCVGGFFLFSNTKISITFTVLLLLVLLLIANLIVVSITYKNGARNLAEQEET